VDYKPMINDYLKRWNVEISECCDAELVETFTRFPRKICTRCRRFAKEKKGE